MNTHSQTGWWWIYSQTCTCKAIRLSDIKNGSDVTTQISMKNMADAPVCLQRMLLQLQDYDFTIKYHSGKEMVVADTLLRYSHKDTPEIQPYHRQQDSLTVEDGLILCGEAIIIPPGERKKVLEQIHQGQLGTFKCQYRARQCVHWPGINKDIEQQVEACTTCQTH